VTPRTAVIGAGYVGRRFAERQPAGSVLQFNRPGFDLDSPGASLQLPDGCSILYTVPPLPGHKNDVRLERLLAASSLAPPRFVYISTTGVYGDCGGEHVDEARPVNPQSDRARLRVAAECALKDWCDEHGIACVILRVPGIYGPGRLGVDRIRSGAANIRESDANPGNRIHVDDLVSCCEAALSDDVPPGIYNVGDGDHRSATWFAKELARQIGAEPPPEITLAQARKEFSEMRLSFLGESRRIDTTKMKTVLGVRLRYNDAVEGIAASIATGKGGRDVSRPK
jgi:nucleoside-diphosphate-sugar epimerase